jgi:hypothetical protein
MRLTTEQGTERLKPLLREQKLIVFAGSGISVPAGLPTWDDLLVKFISFCEELNDLLPAEDILGKLLRDAKEQTEEYPTRVASVLKRRLLELEKEEAQNIYKAFATWLRDTFTAEPHENHRLIVRTNYPFILTSNYDSLLEKAAEEEGYHRLARLGSYTYTEADKIAAAVYQKQPSIIHVHGDNSGIALDEFVFTAEDYVKIRRAHPGFTLIMQTLFIDYSVLFVGYGGSDPHFEDFIENISYCLEWSDSASLPRSFLSLHKDKVGEVLSKYKDRLRTDIIALEEYDETTDLLRALQEACPRIKETTNAD